MTDATTIALITAAGTVITGGVTTYATIRIQQLQNQATATAKVVDATHKLSNSNMGIQLRLYKVSARRNFELSGKPEDLVIAEDAEKAYQNHMDQQAKVDADNPQGLPTAEQKSGKS